MRIFAETQRLVLRELHPNDVDPMFEMDSDPEVHRYLGNNPVTSKDQIVEVIKMVRQQYLDNGIGRWAAIEKDSGNFIGWIGLKLEKDRAHVGGQYYDIGYRLIKKYWGKGYATESAKAAIEYGFTQLGIEEIIGVANIENVKSKNTLERCGLKYFENSMWNEITCQRYKITRIDWEKAKAI